MARPPRSRRRLPSPLGPALAAWLVMAALPALAQPRSDPHEANPERPAVATHVYLGTNGPAGARPIVAFLTGPTFQPRRSVVFDAGLILDIEGFGATALYAGVTWNIGRVPGCPRPAPGRVAAVPGPPPAGTGAVGSGPFGRR